MNLLNGIPSDLGLLQNLLASNLKWNITSANNKQTDSQPLPIIQLLTQAFTNLQASVKDTSQPVTSGITPDQANTLKNSINFVNKALVDTGVSASGIQADAAAGIQAAKKGKKKKKKKAGKK